MYYGEEWVNQQLQQGINTSAKQKINNKRLMIQIQTTRMGQSRSKFKLIRYFTLVGVDSFYKDTNTFIFLKNTSNIPVDNGSSLNMPITIKIIALTYIKLIATSILLV